MSDSSSDSCDLSLSCSVSCVESDELEVGVELETVEPYPEASDLPELVQSQAMTNLEMKKSSTVGTGKT